MKNKNTFKLGDRHFKVEGAELYIQHEIERPVGNGDYMPMTAWCKATEAQCGGKHTLERAREVAAGMYGAHGAGRS